MNEAGILALEKRAMTGDRCAVIQLISAFRLVRSAIERLHAQVAVHCDSEWLFHEILREAVAECWGECKETSV